MTAPGAAGRRPVAVRLAGIGLLAAAVTGALYAAGRLHAPRYAVSLFGQTGLAAVTLKSLLASVVLGLAALHVPRALWIYRKLPLAGSPPRPVRPAHRITGFALFALFATMPKQLPGLKTSWTVLPQVEAMVLTRPPSLCVKPLQIANLGGRAPVSHNEMFCAHRLTHAYYFNRDSYSAIGGEEPPFPRHAP